MTSPTVQHQKPRGMTVPTSSEPIILGIDPGGKTTGLVVRRGRAVLRAILVVNSDAPVLSLDYLAEVVDTVEEILLSLEPCPVIALEDVVEPNPHLGLSNVKGLMDTAQVVGAVRVVLRRLGVMLVRPGGHGSAPLATYPSELVGPNEPKGTGRLRHARSAYDIAGVALVASRTGSLPGVG